MKPKPPRQRRWFADDWDEIGYLYDNLLYWLFERENRERAHPYAERLKRLLPKADPDHEAILGAAYWSLVYEAEGDFRKAIEHRKNEIRLIHRLHEISRGQPFEEFALRRYGYDDLSD